MTRCVVPKCSEIGVHNFPKDAKLRELWLKAIRREDWVPKNSSRLCRKHFVDSDYAKVSKYTGLVKDDQGILRTFMQEKKSGRLKSGMEHQHKYIAKGVILSVFPWTTSPNNEQTKVDMIILNVYNYLDEEYKCLKALNMDGCNLSILENILKRTSEATGVSEETVKRILKEHQTKAPLEEKRIQGDIVVLHDQPLGNQTGWLQANMENMSIAVAESSQNQTNWKGTAIEDMPIILANGPLSDQEIHQLPQGTTIEDVSVMVTNESLENLDLHQSGQETTIEDIPVMVTSESLENQDLHQSEYQREEDDVTLVGKDPYSEASKATEVIVKTEPLEFDRDKEMDITITVKAEPFDGDLDSMIEDVQQDASVGSLCAKESEPSQVKESPASNALIETQVLVLTVLESVENADNPNREQEKNGSSDFESWNGDGTEDNETSDSNSSNRDDGQPKKKKIKYTAAKLKAAVKYLDKGHSVNKASRKFGVPKSTIRDHKSMKHVGTYCESQTVLKTDEELALVEWLKTLKELEFHLNKSLLFETVARMVKDLNRPNPFKDGIPGSHWYHKFSNRHPILLKLITRTSALRLTHGIVRKWFARITKFFNDNNLRHVLEDPDRVFNCDEFALSGNPGDQTLVIRREYTEESSPIVKERMTVVLNICANGKLAPPMVVYPDDKVDNSVPQVPNRWSLSFTESGWIDADSLSKYILDCFYPWLVENDTKFPVILFLDGYTMRISPKLLAFCKDKGIFLIGLLTHGKYALQPLDVGIVNSLEDSWKNVVENFNSERNCYLDRSEFANQVKICLNACISAKTIKIGFQNSYLCPYRPEEINYWKFLRKTKTTASEIDKKDENITTPSS